MLCISATSEQNKHEEEAALPCLKAVYVPGGLAFKVLVR